MSTEDTWFTDSSAKRVNDTWQYEAVALNINTQANITTLDLKSAEEKAHMVCLFVGQSADDTRKKLQKIGKREDLGKLLDIAWTVHGNRDPKGRAKALMVVEDACHECHKCSDCHECRLYW